MSPAVEGRGPVVLWFRRDLRLSDHPALAQAARQGPITAIFVLDDVLLRTAGQPRLAYFLQTLRALDGQLRALGGALTVRAGRPEHVVPEEAQARAVHITADFAPYGSVRDRRVAKALGAVPLVATGSPYAAAPGEVLKRDRRPYDVFTPFYRSWLARDLELPEPLDLGSIAWRPLDGLPIAGDSRTEATCPEPGEPGARVAWELFRTTRLATYAATRDHPALDATSRLSPYLKVGALHPRTLLADLGPDDDAFRRQLAWREFYAAVLYHRPSTARSCFQPHMEGMRYDHGSAADGRFAAWATGRTGFPLVDAGMRQLRAQGWMHNRLRMITASFLVKDLHIDWTRGARHFMVNLIDGDLASNQHNWQWVAGTGADTRPNRVFNPTRQARRYAPEGVYVRRWVPELDKIDGADVHEPWRLGLLRPSMYPEPIVDHDDAVQRFLSARRS
jgi:deoxyribodipyrimidine photo-lyase